MENLRRSMSCGAKMPERRAQQTLFANPPKITQELNECWSSSVLFLEALLKFCGTSAQMAEKFMRVFGQTRYSDTASQFQTATRDLYAATSSVSGQLKSKLDAWFMGIMTREEDHSHVLAKCYLNLIQLHCQFVVTSTDVLAQFCNYSSVEDMQSPQKPEPEVRLPEVSVTDTDDVTNTWEEPVYVSDGQPSKYGDIGSKRGQSRGPSPVGSPVRGQGQGHSPVKVTRSMPASPVKQEPRRAVDLVAGCHGEAITQEELDNVINFLSGTRNPPANVTTKPPPPPPPQHHYNRPGMVTSQSDNVSLTSSLGQSMTSSSSSGSEGHATGSEGHVTLNHRLSDGAIDAIREGRNTWPYIGEPPMTSQSQAKAIYGSSASLGSDPEFLSYVQSVGALIGQSSPIWSPQHQKTNRSWPSHKQPPVNLSPAQRVIRPPESSSSDGSLDEELLLQMGMELSLDRQLHDTGQVRRALTNQQWVSRP